MIVLIRRLSSGLISSSVLYNGLAHSKFSHIFGYPPEQDPELGKLGSSIDHQRPMECLSWGPSHEPETVGASLSGFERQMVAPCVNDQKRQQDLVQLDLTEFDLNF